MKPVRPKVSVIVPTYNRASMLRICIEATLSQTMQDFELIIVSDGSTDETEEVVRSYREPRILFFEKENGGQAAARNLGIVNAKGKYIALCDDDDRFYPNHLSTLSVLLQRNPGLGLAYSDARWCYQDCDREPEIRYSQDFDKKALENFNYITPVNVMFRKSCLQNRLLFNEDAVLKGLEDWDFFLRLSDQHPFLHIKKVTSEYNVHGKNSFHPASGYDYKSAFFLVRKQRFQYLHSKFGTSLFDHVDHMYPLYFVQCYLENGKKEEGFEMATKLQDLYMLYAQKRNLKTSLTEIIILFSLGVSSFMAGSEEKAGFFFDQISTSSGFIGIKKQFCDFVGQYAGTASNARLKAMLIDSFSALR
jgi:glycosyltransferase involved in cell wall biosynthesis